MGDKRQKLTKEQRKRLSEAHKGQKAWNKGMGLSHNPLFGTWSNMLRRCNDHRRSEYKNYGGRGISVSVEWGDFYTFEKDMLPTYEKGLTLERMDNDGDYCMENCKWATHKEQSNNKRNNRVLSFGGTTMTLSMWADKTGIKQDTLSARLNDYGFSLEEALTLPLYARRK